MPRDRLADPACRQHPSKICKFAAQWLPGAPAKTKNQIKPGSPFQARPYRSWIQLQHRTHRLVATLQTQGEILANAIAQNRVEASCFPGEFFQAFIDTVRGPDGMLG